MTQAQKDRAETGKGQPNGTLCHCESEDAGAPAGKERVEKAMRAISGRKFLPGSSPKPHQQDTKYHSSKT